MAPAAVEQTSDVKKAAAVILESVNLDSDQYRLGHTKACTLNLPVGWLSVMYYDNFSVDAADYICAFPGQS